MFLTLSYEEFGNNQSIGYIAFPRVEENHLGTRLKTVEVSGTNLMADVDVKTGQLFGIELLDSDTIYLSPYFGDCVVTQRVLKLADHRALIQEQGGIIGLYLTDLEPGSYIDVHGLRLYFANSNRTGFIGADYIDTVRCNLDGLCKHTILS